VKKKLIVTVVATFLFVCLFPLPISPFKVSFWPIFWGAHENIVADAMHFLEGIPATGISSIIEGAEEPDDQNDLWTAWAHFSLPDEWWEICWMWGDIQRWWDDFLYEASNLAADPNNKERAYTHIGYMFHTIADFYSHTNWIENHNMLDIADLRAEDPPRGLADDLRGPYELPNHSGFNEAYTDAIKATIKGWGYFEDKLYWRHGDELGTRYLINNLGITPTIKVLKFMDRAAHVGATFLPRFRDGYVLGSIHKLEWTHCGIPHDTPVEISLLCDGSHYGYVRSSIMLGEDELSWAFGNLEGGVYATPDNAYPRYAIRIRDLAGMYPPADSQPFYILDPIYGGPTDFSADPVGWGKIHLTWSDNSNCESGFEILRRKEGESTVTVFKAVPTDSEGTVDTTALPDTDYYYQVRAVFTNGQYATAEQVSARVPSGPPLEIQLTAEFDYDTGDAILTWIDPSINLKTVEVQRKASWETQFRKIASVPTTARQYVDGSVSPDTLYYYRIKAANPSGYSYSDVGRVFVRYVR